MHVDLQIVLLHKYYTYFRIIPKRPVTHHLEERVMIAVRSNDGQIIMLSTDTNTFLGIYYSGKLGFS